MKKSNKAYRKCPKCGGDFKCYKTVSDGEGTVNVTQYRKCGGCSHSGKTAYQKWVCLDPKEKP